MTKTTSDRGIKAIALREGEVLHGYLDSKRLLTIGVGHLVKAGEPYKLHQPITQAESDRLLKQDLKEAEDAVNGDVHVALSQNEFDALVSFVVNIGVNGFKKSTVVKRLNKSDHPGAASAMLMWKKPPEIIDRRKTEVHQFLTPDPKSVQPASISLSGVAQPFSIGASVASASDINQGAADVEPPPLAAGEVVKTETVFQKLNTAGDGIQKYSEKITNISNSVAPISKASWAVTLFNKAIGFILLAAGFLYNNPVYLIAAVVLIIVAIWYLSRAKDRANERGKVS